MSEIKIIASMNANYIYHMLSVSKCGYDNTYGSEYAYLHKQKDLDTLKANEELLTVICGKHFGELYSVFVSTPATLSSSEMLMDYLYGTKDLFLNQDPVGNFDKFKEVYQVAYSAHRFNVTLQSTINFLNRLLNLKTEILDICEVLINNYSLYCDTIWAKCKEQISSKGILLEELGFHNIVSKWETLLNHEYPHKEFQVILCNSIKGGVQAIDIGYNKDVFYSGMAIDNLTQIISHEFGIFVLRDKLLGVEDVDFYSNYDVVETIIEYFNPINKNDLIFSNSQKRLNTYLNATLREYPQISIIDLIKRTIDFMSNQ